MRKNLLFIGLALSMLAVGCNNDPVDDGNKKPNTGKKDVTVTVNATLPEGLTWAEGDVYLVNGVEAAALGAEAANAQTAQLVAVNLDSTSPVFVLGPAALRTGASEVTVGDVQKYVADGYDRSVRVLAGGAAEALPVEEGNKNNLTADVAMTTVQGIMTLPLTLDAASVSENPVAVEQITVTALGNEALSGVYAITLSFDKETGQAKATYKASDATSVIDLVCEEPVDLNAESAVDFNFVLPVGVYSGFEFVVTDTEARSYVFNVGEVTIGDPLVPTVLEQVAYKVVEKAPATLNVTIAESGVTWAEGDCIVCNNALSSEVAAASVGTSTATFDFDAVAYPYSVFYPADLYAQVGTIRFRTEQPLVRDGYDRANLAMVGYSNTTDVTLKNLCGVMILPITNNFDADAITINSVNLTAIGGESLSGKYRINYQNATLTPIDVHNTLTLVPSEENAPVVLNPGESINVGIVVPVGSFAKGLIVDIDSNIITEPITVSAEGVEVRSGEETSLEEFVYSEVKIEAINTPELLMEFAKNVNGGRYKKFINENGEVVLGSDIDMSGITNEEFVPIGTEEHPFDGIFNGQGYSIKNWKTSKGLFGMNTGTVKNVVIDSSCAYTVNTSGEGDKNCAFVVEYSTSSSLVEGCVNNASLTATDVSCAGHRIGGVVAAAYGVVKDCTNNGNISVESKAVNNAMNIGGVVGYVNPNSDEKEALGTEFLVGCVNNGSVTVNFPCQPKTVNAGGVVGSTQMSKAASSVYLGTIKNCKNTGAVSYYFEVLASGTYANIGGTVGYSQADIVGCENGGDVTYTVPLTDLTKNATRPALGGVVACTMYSLKDCTNRGKVTGSGIWAAGTSGNAGAGGSHQLLFGGVAGMVGPIAYKADYVVENCNNYGEVNTTLYGKTGGGSQAYTAGVIANTSLDVKNCHNYGQLSLNTFAGESYVAGVLGRTLGTVENCSNNAIVDINCIDMTSTSRTMYMGGVLGRAAKAISGCTNNGNTTMTVNEESKVTPSQLYTGGVVAYADISIEKCTLNASYTLSTPATAASLRCAGVVGQVKTGSGGYTVIECSSTEKASVNLTTKNTKANYVGGIVGMCNNGVKDCMNKATMSINIAEALTGDSITYIAGVAGLQKEDMNNCQNYANIVANMGNSTSPLYAGCLLGHNYAASSTVTSCSNSGNMTITNAGNVENIGFLVGVNAEGATVTESTNTGVVTINGTEFSVGTEPAPEETPAQ